MVFRGKPKVSGGLHLTWETVSKRIVRQRGYPKRVQHAGPNDDQQSGDLQRGRGRGGLLNEETKGNNQAAVRRSGDVFAFPFD